MVLGFEKKKTVINVTSIQERFEERRTVVKPRFFMEGHEDISKERAKRTAHSHAIDKKMDEILSDKSKFELLNEDAIKITLKRENQVKALLKKLKTDNCINDRTYNELYPTGTRIGILYGLPKIHKSSIPLRPILSSINHYSYKIAKFFIPFLTPISSNSLVIKDSFSFVQELLNSDINSNSVVMASFDVTSLFTNIPVGETIEIISNQIFSNCVVFEGLDRSQFIKLQ